MRPENPSDLPLDRGTVRNVLELIYAAHRNLFVAATMLNNPKSGFSPQYEQDSWFLRGVVLTALSALGGSIDHLKSIESKLLSEDKNDESSS